MDDGYERRPRPSGPQRGPASGGQSRPRSGDRTSNGAQGEPPGSGGLLSRYGGKDGSGAGADNSGRGAWHALTGQARRLGENIRRVTAGERQPQHGDWRATDFAPEELEAWDRRDSAPFEVPADPNADDSREAFAAAPGRTRSRADESRPYSARSPVASGRGRQDAQRPAGRGRTTQLADWDDDWEDGGWETGTWDTGWATGFQPSTEDGRRGGGDGRNRRDRYYYDDYEEDDPLAQSLGTLAQLGAIGAPLGRLARLRLLFRRRPAAAAMLAFFMLGFMLTCLAPTIPLLRLGYDAADAARRVSNLQTLFAGGSSTLFNGTKLKDAQTEVDGITHDLYEINGAMSVVAAPLAAVSPQMRNYRLLVRMGYDLTASADEGLNVAQTLLTPLEGGALSTDGSTPGITTDDIQQARAVLADASVRMQDAIAAYNSLNVDALPSQLRPGSRYGNLLGLLPTAQSAIGEISRLLDIAPTLLGVGQPAYYLVVAMDRSELRPGGGFQGNYGILTLSDGKQSANQPFALHDTYPLDQAYFDAIHGAPNQDCGNNVPQPPQYYWWWPYRVDPSTTQCDNDWGLRDANLSPDFPTNARTDMRIVEDAGQVPNRGTLQGVIAFTPVLIEDLLKATGDLPMPTWGVTVTATNLEHLIHDFQLGAHKPPAGVDRKEFTHQMSSALLDRLKSMHGSALKPVLQAAEQALKDKDLQIYFSEPRAELVLQQLGLASEVYTGSGDGFYVVDTNFGGNKANQYVTEHQTDYVTLLPDGGALHRLQIAVTYDKKGDVYDGTENSKSYQDLQRTYLPGDASILGYSGFNPTIFDIGCGSGIRVEIIITDCSPTHVITHPTTASDVSGRTMVLGPITVWCGPAQSILNYSNGAGTAEDDGCATQPQPHTVNVFIEWYTPHAFTMDASGHGTYSELVEKQPGSADFLVGSGNYLSVYVDTSQLHADHPQLGDYTYTDSGDAATTFAALIQGKKPFISNQQITSNIQVNYNF
jgi:hypothetical protein